MFYHTSQNLWNNPSIKNFFVTINEKKWKFSNKKKNQFKNIFFFIKMKKVFLIKKKNKERQTTKNKKTIQRMKKKNFRRTN